MNFKDLIKSDLRIQNKMYADGVITVKAPKGHFKRTLRRLEDDTGLNFEFTRSARKAEITCVYDELTNNAGEAFGNSRKGRYRVEVEPNHWYSDSVVVHELGHALGLGHVSGRDSIMSYDRDYNTDYFMPADLHAITHVFDLDHSSINFY